MSSGIYPDGKNSLASRKPVAVLILQAITWSLASSMVYGDIGSKHREAHRRAPIGQTEKHQARPFDFPEIADTVGILHEGAIEQHLGMHVEQSYIESLSGGEAFAQAFEQGDELFEINYNAIDGVGVNVGNGKRFSTLP